MASDREFVRSARLRITGLVARRRTLVQTATFKDSDSKERSPSSGDAEVWTWNGDKTYSNFGATIYPGLRAGAKRKTTSGM